MSGRGRDRVMTLKKRRWCEPGKSTGTSVQAVAPGVVYESWTILEGRVWFIFLRSGGVVLLFLPGGGVCATVVVGIYSFKFATA